VCDEWPISVDLQGVGGRAQGRRGEQGGQRSRQDRPRFAADAVRARLRVYLGAGHFLPEERPDDVAADITALLDAPAPAAA
jgi:pimeloyl-ACP methyl ester carboxylesterase